MPRNEVFCELEPDKSSLFIDTSVTVPHLACICLEDHLIHKEIATVRLVLTFVLGFIAAQSQKLFSKRCLSERIDKRPSFLVRSKEGAPCTIGSVNKQHRKRKVIDLASLSI